MMKMKPLWLKPTICAWCLKEKGIPTTKEDSHGICDKHYTQIMKEMDEEGGDDGKND